MNQLKELNELLGTLPKPLRVYIGHRLNLAFLYGVGIGISIVIFLWVLTLI